MHNGYVNAVEPVLVGREHEIEEVARWWARVDEGPSGLVWVGEVGIGKSTLWQDAVTTSRAAGATVLSARPVEAELALGFSGLADLLGEFIDELIPEMPTQLGDGVASALFRKAPDFALDPQVVARGLVECLRILEARGPLVMAVEDVQWLDPSSARALAFAVRRLQGRVGVLATWRNDSGVLDPLQLRQSLGDRLVTVELGPLSAEASGRLLRVKGFDLPRRSMLRLHAISEGNPLYALELARASETAGLPPALSSLVSQRLAGLPQGARSAAELVSVLGRVESHVLATSDHVEGDALDMAVAQGVLVVDDGDVYFSHPVLAAGTYESLGPGRCRDLHRHAVSLVTGAEAQARHIALATGGHDRHAAEVLEDAAALARARGAPEAAAELAHHASRLTGADDGDQLIRRSVLEADLLYLSGEDQAAVEIVERVLRSDVRGVLRARALIHRVQHDVDPWVAVKRLEEAVSEATEDVVVGARALASLAWMRGMWAGDVESAIDESHRAVMLAERAGEAAVLTTALTTAATLHAYRGDPEAEGLFRRALVSADGIEWIAGDRSPLVAFAHQRFWRAEWLEADELLSREHAQAQASGEDSRLERLNIFRADFEIRRGHWADADRLLLEAVAWAPPGYWRARSLLWRALLRGRRGDPRALDDVAESSAAATDPTLIATAAHATGLLALAQGRPQDAVGSLQPLLALIEQEGPRELAVMLVEPDLVEALVAVGDVSAAEEITDRLERRARESVHPLGLPASARCRALLSLGGGDIASALAHSARAREEFEKVLQPYELARTLLVEGTALRRGGRRTLAGDALERARTIFESLDADQWAQRCSEELRRARPRPRATSTLTEAESRVASLVIAGQTNREVAAQLFMSVATVEAHLTRIYRKTGVRSRTELSRAAAQHGLGSPGA